MSGETNPTIGGGDPNAPIDPALAAFLTGANTNNAQLNTTLQALLTHFTTPTIPVHDLYASPNAFNLAQRSGLTAYEKACEPLKVKWDGGSTGYPSFIIELRDRARDCKWDTPGITGIMNIPQDASTINILHNYHGLQEASVNAAFAARTNLRLYTVPLRQILPYWRCIHLNLWYTRQFPSKR